MRRVVAMLFNLTFRGPPHLVVEIPLTKVDFKSDAKSVPIFRVVHTVIYFDLLLLLFINDQPGFWWWLLIDSTQPIRLRSNSKSGRVIRST